MASSGRTDSCSKTSVMIFRTNDLIGIAADSKSSLPSGRAYKHDTDKIVRLRKSIFMAGVGSRHMLKEIAERVPRVQHLHPPMMNAASAAIPTTTIVNDFMSSQLSHLRLKPDVYNEIMFKKEMKRLQTEIYFIDRYSVVKIANEPLMHTPWNHTYKVVDPSKRVIYGGSGTPILERVYSERFGPNGEHHPATMELEACVDFLKDCIWAACQEDWGSGGGRINVVVLGHNFCRRKVWSQVSTRKNTRVY